MSTVVNVNIDGALAVAQRLESLGMNLTNILMPANQAIVNETEATLADLYPNMASRFVLTINDVPSASILASVKVTGHQAILKWYEYGTRMHIIEATNAQALAFMGTHEMEGEMVFAPEVLHPGAKAHNEAGILAGDMEITAMTEWSAILENLALYF